MEFNIKFDEKMVAEAANRVLDEYMYNGKTIREWADALTHPKSNADRIRAMTDEELADEILRWFNWLNAVEWDDKRIIGWLKQEAKDV